MKRRILITLSLIISINCYTQSIGINHLIEFKNQKIGQIEETLTLDNWENYILEEKNNTGILKSLGNRKKYIFKYITSDNYELAKINITLSSKSPNKVGVFYETEDFDNYKGIIKNLKNNSYKMINSTSDLKVFFNPKLEIGARIFDSGISKTYSDGINKVNLSTIKYKEVTDLNEETYKYITVTVYELKVSNVW
ncbi:conserved protein of unknown function [Tenacibaculum soleae]|uniref:hypothetical protein n=1 Tax=Tenacibaculum soleae TaxID=447689 RepID=UPI003AB126CB